MKKIFKSQLTYLILLVIVNLGLIFGICITVNNSFKRPVDYLATVENYDEPQTITKEYFTIQKGDVEIKEYFESYLIQEKECFKTITLDTCSIEVMQEIKTGEKIGTIDDNDVLVEDNCYCLNIIENSGKHEATFYVYNSFSIKCPILDKDFMKNIFDNNFEYYVDFGVKKIKASFINYDLSEYESTHTIYGCFELENNNLLLTEDTTFSFYKVSEVKHDVYYVDAAAFDYESSIKTFIVRSNNQTVKLSFAPEEIIENIAIIDFQNITEGMVIYAA